MSEDPAVRQAVARQRIEKALASGGAALARLSDVFYDAKTDEDDNYGYDCDDLAAVLFDRLKSL